MTTRKALLIPDEKTGKRMRLALIIREAERLGAEEIELTETVAWSCGEDNTDDHEPECYPETAWLQSAPYPVEGVD